MHRGELALLYLSPERLVSPAFLQAVAELRLSYVAVDEAHCISMWGHDFRPEYRALGLLKERFPGVSLHAFTATATPQVREDIARQLRLDSPEIQVGSFHRPNLVYRVRRRSDPFRQVTSVLAEHRNESGIIYCLRRTDVDRLCQRLTDHGYSALPYHAGLEDDLRKQNQDEFIQEKADIIVATVAFGMGIDKSNVRFVIHTGMPRSVEHYQQESGRAGPRRAGGRVHFFSIPAPTMGPGAGSSRKWNRRPAGRPCPSWVTCINTAPGWPAATSPW